MEDRKYSVGSRLQQIMDERNLRSVDLHDLVKPLCKKYDISISKSQLSQYINDFNEPGQRRLFIIAQALDVNEAWLLGYDVDRARKPVSSNASERAEEFVALFSQLTNEEKAMIIHSMKGILASR